MTTRIGQLRYEEAAADFLNDYKVNGRLAYNHVERRHLPPRLRGIVTFAYYTGWRVPSEVLPLQRNHVDLTVGTVRLEPGTTKNRHGRLIKFNELAELRQTS